MSKSSRSDTGEPRDAQRKIRVLCVDDHAFLVDGMRARMELEPDFEFVGRLPSARELVREVKAKSPDIVLLDIEMPGPDAFEAAEEVHRLCPSTRVVFLSAYIRDHYVGAAFKVGAWGYFSKSEEPEAILSGLRRIAAGEFAFGPKVAERCQRSPLPGARVETHGKEPPSPKLDLLTAREQEVLRLIGRGLSRAQIAKSLSRSPKTIDGHREKIMEKLDIHSGPELVRFAIREGLAEA